MSGSRDTAYGQSARHCTSRHQDGAFFRSTFKRQVLERGRKGDDVLQAMNRWQHWEHALTTEITGVASQSRRYFDDVFFLFLTSSVPCLPLFLFPSFPFLQLHFPSLSSSFLQVHDVYYIHAVFNFLINFHSVWMVILVRFVTSKETRRMQVHIFQLRIGLGRSSRLWHQRLMPVW